MWLRSRPAGPEYPGGKRAPVQPEWRLSTCSERHRKYGIHPTSPSVSENFRSGNLPQNSAQISSIRVNMLIIDDAVMATLGGASDDTVALREDDPTSVLSTVLFSHPPLTTASHSSQWIVPIPITSTL